jgi:hypothetical protein
MVQIMTQSQHSTRCSLPRLSIILALAFASVACGDPEPTIFAIHFSVKADDKLPIANAAIQAQAKNAGATDGSGELNYRLKGFEGDRVAISLTCPDGYAASPAQSVVILRSVQGLDGQSRRPITHDLNCQPTKRDAVVLVHVGGQAASLPVAIDGAVVGQTDSLGFAHLHLRSDPGSRFEVSLDTSSNDKLMPQNPKQVYQIEQKDEIFVFDKSFKLPPKPKAKRRGKAAPKVHIPTRLN